MFALLLLYVKFQNSSFHILKITEGKISVTRGRTYGRTNGMDEPTSICPSNLFKVWDMMQCKEMLNKTPKLNLGPILVCESFSHLVFLSQLFRLRQRSSY